MALSTVGKFILQSSKCRTKNLKLVKECHRHIVTSCLVQTKQQQNFIERIEDNSDQKIVEVKWENGETSRYPHIFLRDNCQCPSCFHVDTKSRMVDVFQDIDINITASKVEYSKDHVTVTWPDDHQSTFDYMWLNERKFPQTIEDIQPTTMYGMDPVLWDNSKMAGNIFNITYEDLLSNDDTLFGCIENMILYGLCLIKQAPIKPSTVTNVGKRMATNLLRRTHYGKLWDVKSKASPNNLAYTSNKLSLHTDLPYYSYQPCIQLLHCIEQIGGGENEGCNVFSDGVNAINQIKTKHPEYYELLTTVKVRFNDIGRDSYGQFHKQYERPIIGLDHFGRIESVATSIEVRDSFINAPVEDVIKLYRAYNAFRQMIHHEENTISHKMVPGDILVFDNKRIVHGRSQYDPNRGGRWLQGCYVDWDEVLSTYRVIKDRATKNSRWVVSI